jgi:hypothetical protein
MERIMRAASIFAVAVLAAASLTACSSDDPVDTPQTPGIQDTPETPDIQDTPSTVDSTGSRSVFDLEVGLCYNYPDDTTLVGEVPLADCASSHDAEVFAIYNLPEYEAYDQDTVTSEGFDGCLAPFTAYVGTDYYSDEADDLGIYGLYPSPDTWANGDREVICSVVPLTQGDQLTGSMRNARG